ncbi:porin family protein [Pseudoalteromonas aurantia]|uniref:Porin family protein n=1 Tax=Pseudoalteromonas aurantia TaxID=43654 RepID=A0A5S3V2L6_9GAMM|nr:porin family protein [Pseudoalteromonas aurantia]TMO65006.1 porin family protein [Pseudoalteromonas aurantia]TMO73610.1 porin family protein [Pseudoalteromonas aurantia]
MKILSVIALSLVGTLTFTSQAAQNDEQHRVGAQLSGGSASYQNSKQDGDGVGQLYAYYNYQFNAVWAFEAGISTGSESDDWKCKEITNNKFTCDRQDELLFDLKANKLDYSNFITAAKGQYQLTENNHIYAKLGAQFYEYEIAQSSKILVDEDGVGIFAEAGWQYDWDNGVAVNLAWQYMDMGDLEVNTLGVGLSYRF